MICCFVRGIKAMLFRFTPRQLAGMTAIMLLAPAYFACDASAQQPQDPGVRRGPAGAGGPLSGLGTPDLNLFNAALARFKEVDSVSGTIESGVGLGPRFNANSCAACHAQPAVGGTSPAVNPEVAVATLHGAQNTVPSFITLNGPVREARFVIGIGGHLAVPPLPHHRAYGSRTTAVRPG